MTATHAGTQPVTVAYTFLDFGEGGAQRLALDTWKQLDPARFRPVLVCARGRGSLVPVAIRQGLPVHCLGRLERSGDPGAVLALAKVYRELGAQIVQVPLYSRVSPYARLAAGLAGLPLTVAQEHSRPAPPPRRRRIVDRMLRGLLPATRFLAVSDADRAWLVANGVPEPRIAVVRNGIDVRKQAVIGRVEAREALGLSRRASLVLVPARLHPQKRHVDILAAAALLAPRMPDLQFLCAGDGPLRPQLEALTVSAGLEGRVHFLGHREDLPRLLAAVDLVALASGVEGLPLALLEAQAAGRAVVATAVGGVPEIIEDGVTGRLVPPRRPARLAEALRSLLEDPAAAAAMANRARAQARRDFRIEDSVRQLERCYARWLAESRRRPAASVSRLAASGCGDGR